jgi:hypothetical protein
MLDKKMKKLLNEILLTSVILGIAIWIGVLLYKVKMSTLAIEELKQKAFGAETRHAMEVDSLKFKMFQDSLKIVDLQRINYINTINQQDKQDKDERDQIIATIPTATDKQRDQLWTTYSPKN